MILFCLLLRFLLALFTKFYSPFKAQLFLRTWESPSAEPLCSNSQSPSASYLPQSLVPCSPPPELPRVALCPAPVHNAQPPAAHLAVVGGQRRRQWRVTEADRHRAAWVVGRSEDNTSQWRVVVHFSSMGKNKEDQGHPATLCGFLRVFSCRDQSLTTFLSERKQHSHKFLNLSERRILKS